MVNNAGPVPSLRPNGSGEWFLGQPALNVPVTNVYGALQRCRSVKRAADELGCSRGYVYKILTTNGLTPEDVIMGLATKDNRLLHKGDASD